MVRVHNMQYAFLDENNIVKHVFIFEEEDIDLLNQVKDNFNLNSFIESTEDNLACINGDFYNGKFYPEKPYPSWIRNEELAIWDPPIQYPDFDIENPDKQYVWNEDIVNWEEIQVSE